MFIKFIIFIVFYVGFVKSNPYILTSPFFIQKAYHDCKSDLSLDVPKAEKKRSLTEVLNFPIFDHKFACLSKCILEKSEILSGSGDLNNELIPVDLQPISRECNEISRQLPDCDRAHNLTICLIEKTAKKVNETLMECANQTSTHLDMTKHYKLKDFLKEKKYYCMNRCVLIKLNFADESNGIKLDMVKNFAPNNANIPEIVEKCTKDETSSDQCKMVVKRQLCINKKIKKLTKEMIKD